MNVVIVGGGTAGWLTAAVIASQHRCNEHNGVTVAVIESANIPSIAVGEGTWPTMRNTLHSIGLREKDVFKRCGAAFKQGGKFVNWRKNDGSYYYHPFNVPTGYGRFDLAPYLKDPLHYAEYTSFQHHVCEAGLAPRTLADGEYQSPCNYAYHLDACAFGELLREHCVNKLGVTHTVGDVCEVNTTDKGEIASLMLASAKQINADLFVDCTGMKSLLLGQALQVDMKDVSDVLFNDSALAIQVPYEAEDSAIAPYTIATAQNAGWIWDIGLSTRRGVGHVYSSKYLSDDEAEHNLRNYLGDTGKGISCRKIAFNSGYRKVFWKNNCVAVGLSAGFVEPLEATAIMLVELSARFIANNLTPDLKALQVVSQRFNEQMYYRWQRIIDFLKLHYMLTQRDEPYWQDHRLEETFPQSLKNDMMMWNTRGPTIDDFNSAYELFPAASYQYVLYGMGFTPDFALQKYLYNGFAEAESLLRRTEKLSTQFVQNLPTHRDYIENWLANAQ